MKKTKYIWMDGKFIAWDKAKIHFLTHSLQYGEAAFEGIRFYQTQQGPAIFRLHDHIKRLYYSASVLDLKPSLSQNEFKKIILTLIKRNKASKGYIRPMIYYKLGSMGVNPLENKTSMAIAQWDWQNKRNSKYSVKIASFQRIHPRTVDVNAKITGYYANSILAGLEARKQGYDEAILLDNHQNVTEGPSENIFIVKNGILKTPSKGKILPGITRSTILSLAQELKIKAKECRISQKDLMLADEVFFCGTAIEIQPINQINLKKFNSAHPITEQLMKAYHNIMHGKTHHKWLTPISSL